MWIILPATSGAPHGTADCSKRGRWAPSSGLSYIYTHRQGSTEHGRQKGYEVILQDKCSSESWQTPCPLLSSASHLTATASCFQVTQTSFIYTSNGCFIPRISLHVSCTRWNNLGCCVLLKDDWKCRHEGPRMCLSVR